MEHFIEGIDIESDKIDNPIKIGSFSDLHLKKDIRALNYIKSVIEKIREINPDYITGLGDYYYGHKKEKFEMRDSLIYLLHALREIAPVILCLGNHDLSIENERELRRLFHNLESKNIYPLDNESIEFKNIYFSSYFARRDAYAVSKMTKRKTELVVNDLNKAQLIANSNKFSNLLCHNPYIVLSPTIRNEFSNLYDYDLISSGHCHNGMFSYKVEQNMINRIDKIISKLKGNLDDSHQRIIDFLESMKTFGIITGPSPITRFARGLHEINGTKLFISRGVTNQNKNGDSFISEINVIPRSK